MSLKIFFLVLNIMEFILTVEYFLPLWRYHNIITHNTILHLSVLFFFNRFLILSFIPSHLLTALSYQIILSIIICTM